MYRVAPLAFTSVRREALNVMFTAISWCLGTWVTDGRAAYTLIIVSFRCLVDIIAEK